MIKSLSIYLSIFILIIVDLQSCQTNVANQNDRFTVESDTSKNNSTFLDEISSLKDTKYPIELFCEINSDSSIYIDRTNAYFNEGEHLVSKHQDSNYISILSYEVGDYNYPYLKTYNEQGHLIDSIYLFNGHCGEDEFGKTDVYTTLTKNSIYQIDTSHYYHLTNGNQSLDSILVSTSKIELDMQGKFNEIDNQSHCIWVNDTSLLNLKTQKTWSEEIIDTFILVNNLESFFNNNPFIIDLNYPKLKMINQTEKSISFSDDTITFIIKREPFNAIEHSFGYYKETDQIISIDEKKAWGTDGNIPFYSLSDIQIISNTKSIHINKEQINDLFEPNLATDYTNIYKVQPNYYIIKMDNSDAAGSYVVLFFIKNFKIVNRITFLPF